MSGTTTAFGWVYPTSTDLVKDGATAIQTLADDIDDSLKRHGCVITRTSTQSIPNVTGTAVTMNSELLDTDGYHSTVTNTSRITIPAGLAGVYAVTAYCRWDTANNVTNPIINITRNGVSQVRNQTSTTGIYLPTGTAWIGYCAVGDYLEMVVYHSSGANRNVDYVNSGGATNNDPLSPVLSAFRVGGPA